MDEQIIEKIKKLDEVNYDLYHFIDSLMEDEEDNNYLWNIICNLNEIEKLINEICKYVVTRP